MTQTEVLNYLKKRKTLANTKEIAKALKISSGSVLANLKRLEKQRLVIQMPRKYQSEATKWELRE